MVLDKIIGKVDNYILLKSELDLAFLQAVASGQKGSKNLTCQILENLLISKLLLAKADIDSVVVDDKTVDDQLNRRMEYFIAQIGSEKKLEEYYNKPIDKLKSDLRRQVKEQMLAQKMQDQISGKIKVTPGEVKRFYEEIPKDSLPYFSKEVEIGQIVMIAGVSKNQKALAREKLQRIKDRILAGENFGELAKQFSEDYVSARGGGELGFFKRGELVPEYEAASFKLKPNDISDIVESQFGFHLIQLIERRGNEYNTRHILIKANSSTVDVGASANFLDSLRTRIMADSISFERAAKKYSDDKGTKDNGGLFLDSESGSTKIAMENIDPGIFFIIDTMTVGNITRPLPFRTEDGKEASRIVWFKSKTAPHVANLKDDYQKIASAAISEKKAGILEEWFKKTRGEVFIDVDKEFNHCDILKLE